MPWESILPEILDAIISFLIAGSIDCAPSSHDSYIHSELLIRRDLLSCGRVCRAWTPVVRRHFMLTHFPLGATRISPTADKLSQFLNVLDSPYCTFDPGFFKTIYFVSNPHSNTYGPKTSSVPSAYASGSKNTSLFDKLSTITSTSLSSVHTLKFLDATPHTNFDDEEYFYYLNSLKGGNTDATKIDPSKLLPTPPLFSQIKQLTFHNSVGIRFKDIVHTIRHFNAVETVNVYGPRCDTVLRGVYPSLRPPETLQSVSLDMDTLREMIRWFTSCEPPHTNITTLAISDFCWDTDFDREEIRYFLNEIGSNLQEVAMSIYNPHSWAWDSHAGLGRYMLLSFPPLNFHLNPSSEPIPIRKKEDQEVNPFLNNSSIKRLMIAADLDVICEMLPYLFCQSAFAPSLEKLEVLVSGFFLKESLHLLPKLMELDDYLNSRTSIRRVLFSPSEAYHYTSLSDDWKILEVVVRKCLGRTQYQGRLELKTLSNPRS